MIARALDTGTPAARVGGDPGLRADLERRQTGYVLAVAASHQVATAAGTCPARRLAARLPRRAWQRYPAGAGAKGHRYYDWAWLAIGPGRPGHRHLLIRRSRRTGEPAFYRCYSPRYVPLPALVKTAGIRWTTEENFQADKGLTGLGEHQGPPLGLLVPLDHPGHARPGVPHHRCRHRARQPATRRSDPADPQRNRRPVQRPDHRASPRHPAPAAMAGLASPPAPRQNLPLPAASQAAMKITPLRARASLAWRKLR
jgi:hypothetical protein